MWEIQKEAVLNCSFRLLVQTRNVDSKQQLGELPSFVSPLLEKMSMFQKLDGIPADIALDQLTV